MGYYIPDGPPLREPHSAPTAGRVAAVRQRLRETLKNVRLETRLSQTKLSQRAVIPGRKPHTRHALSRWENGELVPTFEDLVVLVGTLGITSVELLWIFSPVIDPPTHE